MSIIDSIIEDEEEAVGSPTNVAPSPPQGRSRSSDPMGLLDLFGGGALPSSIPLPPLTVPSLVYAQLLDRAAGATGVSAPPAIAATTTSHPPADLSGTPSQSHGGDGQGGDSDKTLALSDADGDRLEGGTSSAVVAGASEPAAPSPQSSESAVVALARYQLEQRARRLPEDAATPTAR